MKIPRLLKVLIAASIFLCLAYFFVAATFSSARVNSQRSQCQSNLKQIALACSYYTKDYDGVLPPISQGQTGWAGLIEPESKMWPVFHCPSGVKAEAAFSSDYFFNARIAGEKRSRISAGILTIAFGDGLDNGATNSHLSELPLDWKSDEKSPANRHLSGANYAFVDGHVKWFRPDKIGTEAPSEGGLTFAVR